MTLDENPYAEPEWMRLARKTEAEDREILRREAEILEDCEGEGGAWSKWHHPEYGIFALSRQRPEVHYDEQPGIDRRGFAVDGERTGGPL